ncbi:MAG: alpha/beta hydrolase [Firmicutes bacterium]|nr:alpha/beta hydrolase [Bacillota bacterium]
MQTDVRLRILVSKLSTSIAILDDTAQQSIQPSSSRQTIVFLHGWGGSIDSFIYIAKALSTKYRCILIDLVGHGKTDYPNAPFTIYDYAEHTLEVLKALQVDNTYIVAHSFGGRIALLLSAYHPALIKKQILTGCAGIKPKRKLKVRLKILQYKIAKRLVKLGLRKKCVLNKYGSKDYKALTPARPSNSVHTKKPCQTATDNLKKSFISVVNHDLTRYLKYIDTPTLLVWGKNDVDTPIYMAHKLNKHIKDSGLIVYEGDHFAYLQNANAFIKVTKHFFD